MIAATAPSLALRLFGPIDRAAVLAQVRDDSDWSPRYLLMALLSAGIAMLGLLQSSPAVVIGAMLISPLMGPIIGLGFALAVFDWASVRRSGIALAAGAAVGVGFAALLVLVSPLQAVTSEILARTRPNLFDLAIAVFSALAGGYATVTARGATIVGVAIATALMPPLATVGFGLATGNAAIAGGALALFVTNLVAIALSAAVVARLAGFAAGLSPRQTRVQTMAIALVLAALALPLAVSLRQIAAEAGRDRAVRQAIAAAMGKTVRIAQLDIDDSRRPAVARAVVLTTQLESEAEARINRRLASAAGIVLHLEQLLVRDGSAMRASLAEQRQALAQADAARAAEGEANAIAEALTILAGDGNVSVDSTRRSAVAMPPPPVSLARLRGREAALTARHPGWSIRVVPPAATLLTIGFAAGDADNPDADALADAGWALARWQAAAVRITGHAASRDDGDRRIAEARAQTVASALALPAAIGAEPPGPAQRRAETEHGLARFRSVTVDAVAADAVAADAVAADGAAAETMEPRAASAMARR